MPDGETAGDVPGEAAEMIAHAPRLRGGRLWRIGSSASKRVARCAAWMPTHSAEQWSIAMNTATWPSPVIVVVRSVPHIVSTVSGMMVPSWLRGPRGDPTRDGASRSFSRMSRSTRRFEVRTRAMRSRPSAGIPPAARAEP
jgi:hypothetical protein